MKWEFKTCDKYPRWAWIIKDSKILTHQLPGWNQVPPAHDCNYLTREELELSMFLLEESFRGTDRQLRFYIQEMIKLHLKL